LRAREQVCCGRVTDARFFSLDYVERAVLRDGTIARMRLLAPEDRDILRRGFEQLSQSSRYARFMAPKQRLTDEELRYLTEVDQERHFAIGAIAEAGDGHGEAIGLGIARFICLPDPPAGEPRVAEAAIAVADRAQRQGLGKLLFLRLIAAAAERGVNRFRCEVLCDNASMRELIRQTAPEYSVEIRAGVMSIELELPTVTPDEPAATAPRENALYRLFRAAARDVVEWTDAVGRLWHRRAPTAPPPPAALPIPPDSDDDADD
jgi:GNAT superfamily N-acetyltransferase